MLVDATVRLAVRQPADDKDPVLGYDPAEEIGVHAVCVSVVLRLMARSTVPSEHQLLVRATRSSKALALLAPVGAGVDDAAPSVRPISTTPTASPRTSSGVVGS